MTYTHWLVTRGQFPYLEKRRSFTPLLLAEKASTTFPALRRSVTSLIEERTLLFLPEPRRPVDVLRAFGTFYYTSTISDLWLHEVRVSHRNSPFFKLEADEVLVDWVLFEHGKKVPKWQGPADKVIPVGTSVTIIHHGASSPFTIIGD